MLVLLVLLVLLVVIWLTLLSLLSSLDFLANNDEVLIDDLNDEEDDNGLYATMYDTSASNNITTNPFIF